MSYNWSSSLLIGTKKKQNLINYMQSNSSITRLMFRNVTMSVHQVGLNFAQCIILQIMEKQSSQSDQHHLDATDGQQHLQQYQLEMGELQEDSERQNDLPLFFLVVAFLFA